MALKKKPMTGMKDILPEEMKIRDYVISQIKETYRSFGFLAIETPCVEHLENLTSKQGGDNEKLIFKILKRGQKLKIDEAATESDLTSGGLRYDLTVPLSRYYANNAANLPTPFKALQIGSVWRADNPQKGRYRQFVQCDIDVLGDATPLAEIELILASTTALGKICPENSFTVRINDRGILRGMASYCGFPEESFDQVFIILDKMDKIGKDGVARELIEAGYPQNDVEKYLALFDQTTSDVAAVQNLGNILKDVMPSEVTDRLSMIMETVSEMAATDFTLSFDPTLVRGMSYYTGTIFEVAMEGFGGSVAGGGRYDKMIGKFTGMETPACGFSIGFERIVGILMDRNFKVPSVEAKKVYLYEKGLDQIKLKAIIKEAMDERDNGIQVLVAQMMKNKKFQKEQLHKEGYQEFKEFYKQELKH